MCTFGVLEEDYSNFNISAEFWDSISHYTSTNKLTKMPINVLPVIKKKSPNKKSPPCGNASKRKRTSTPKASASNKKSKTGK